MRKIIYILIFVFALTSFSGIVLAQDFIPLAPVETPGGENLYESNNLSSYLNNAIKIVIGIAIALAIIMITIGGLQKMSTDSIYKQDEGSRKIREAIWGLVLAIVSFLILATIDQNILSFSLDPGEPPGDNGVQEVEETPPGELSKDWCYEVYTLGRPTTVSYATEEACQTNRTKLLNESPKRFELNSSCYSGGSCPSGKYCMSVRKVDAKVDTKAYTKEECESKEAVDNRSTGRGCINGCGN